MTEKWCVINLGDAGRSPRMANHIEQISARKGAEVDYLTFAETELPPSLTRPNVHVYALDHFALNLARKLPFFLYFWLRFMLEVLTLQVVFAVSLRKRYNFILVQNPYALPALWVLVVYKLFVKECKVIIDIHNFGYTLVGKGGCCPATEAESAEKNAVPSLLQTLCHAVGAVRQLLLPLVRIFYEFVEVNFIRLVADEALVVSRGMRDAVEKEWGLPAERIKLLCDTPNTSAFKPLSLAEKHEFLSLFKELDDGRGGSLLATGGEGKVVEKKNRPLVLTVSTSWGADDDFGTLIEAVELYKKSGAKRQLDFFFTGTGALKGAVAPRLKALSSDLVKVHVKWFDAKDYAKIIGCSDYTVSVHKSLSGVDLPIKILDSFRCEVPVIALNYSPVIAELVSESNGYLYESAQDLGGILKQIGEQKQPKSFSFGGETWAAEWKKLFK